MLNESDTKPAILEIIFNAVHFEKIIIVCNYTIHFIIKSFGVFFGTTLVKILNTLLKIKVSTGKQFKVT